MLELKNVKKTFYPGSPNERQALKNISLKLETASFTTVIGGNGAGKSTLLNAIAGTFPINSGEIILGGKNISKSPEYKRAKYIGHLQQDPLKGTAPSMTIEENLALAYGQKNRKIFQIGISKKERNLFREQLSTLGLGLEDRLFIKMGLLSGGQRQAITLIMATLATPEILLLDEHTSALDPGTAEKVMDLTVKIVAEKKITTLMITHNIESALAVGDRTLMMNQGEIAIDISGEKRKNMKVEEVLNLFRDHSGQVFSEDRILLETV